MSLTGTVLAGLAWLPDSRHLLVAGRLGDPALGGPVRTRLLLIDAGPARAEQLDRNPNELVILPAEALLGRAVWSTDGHRVALLASAASAPGGKNLLRPRWPPH